MSAPNWGSSLRLLGHSLQLQADADVSDDDDSDDSAALNDSSSSDGAVPDLTAAAAAIDLDVAAAAALGFCRDSLQTLRASLPSSLALLSLGDLLRNPVVAPVLIVAASLVLSVTATLLALAAQALLFVAGAALVLNLVLPRPAQGPLETSHHHASQHHNDHHYDRFEPIMPTRSSPSTSSRIRAFSSHLRSSHRHRPVG